MEPLFKALADTTRQRLLRVLSLHELSVSELVKVLEQPQSTLSRHLKVLRDAGLLVDRRAGTTVMYSTVPPNPRVNIAELDFEQATTGNRIGMNGTQPGSSMAGLRDRLLEWLGQERLDNTIQNRIHRVVQQRSPQPESFFESVGTRWDQLRFESFGNAFHYEALTALLPPEWTVADIGSGTGYLLEVLAAHFRTVIAVDPAPTMLEVARNRPELKAVRNVVFREGSVANLPLETGEVDLAIASLVLHHVAQPERDLRELRRGVREGGRLLIIEQETHQHAAFHDRMGDHWRGFSMDTLAQWVGQAGFADVQTRRLATARTASPRVGDVPGLFVLTARAAKSKKRSMTRNKPEGRKRT